MMSSATSASTSISDLVPFVAAVLKDQAVTDENKELRQQLNDSINERLLVQVTGPNGTPVYYQGSLKDGGTLTCENDRYRKTNWMVYFVKKKDDNNSADDDIIVIPLHLIGDLEIRLGGLVVLFMSDARTSTNWHDYAEEFVKDKINPNKPQMGGVHFANAYTRASYNNSPVAWVHGRIGPVSWSDYHRDRTLDNMKWLDLKMFADDDSNPTQDLTITAIEFNKDVFGESIISLLEQMGTSTTNVYNESWMRSVRSIGRPPAPIVIGGEDDADVDVDVDTHHVHATINTSENENENNTQQKRKRNS